MSITKPINPNTYKITGCFCDDQFKLCLIHIYKNASLAMRNAMNMRGKYFEYDEVKDKNLIKICCFRDPISRIISSYSYMLNPREADHNHLDQHPINITKKTLFYEEKDNVIDSFNYFLDAIDGGNFYDAVTYPQYKFLEDKGLTIDDIDEIIIQSSIVNDFDRIKSKYNIKGNLDFVNRTDSNKKKLIEYYIYNNKQVYERILNLYKEDFDLYEIAKEKMNNI